MTVERSAPDGLGRFLRARRGRLAPVDVGIPVHSRRRTPGLRREEVAALAGVSVDYYTRLEQGRDRRPSASVLGAIGHALRLGDDELEHLHLLAGAAPPRPSAPMPARVRPPVDALLTGLAPAPAYALTPRLDVVAWNTATVAVLFDPGAVPPDERNLARLTLLDPRLRRLWADWESVARETVAQLRAASGRYPADPRLRALIGELLVSSPEFAGWWAAHDVAAACHPHKQVDHPRAGALRFFHETLELTADALRVVVHLPADDATARACSALQRPEVATEAPPRRLRALERR